jgi:hypothetical protein
MDQAVGTLSHSWKDINATSICWMRCRAPALAFPRGRYPNDPHGYARFATFWIRAQPVTYLR